MQEIINKKNRDEKLKFRLARGHEMELKITVGKINGLTSPLF